MTRFASHRPRLERLEARTVPTTLPTGFSETIVTTAATLSSPTAMDFSPDGQLWVLQQGGQVKVIRSDGSAVTAATLTVDAQGERGLLGIAFAPDYDGAGPNVDHVYLYYTDPASGTDPANNRVSRFTVTGAGTDTPTLGGEQVLRDLPPNTEDADANHNGGAIHFGPDGMLYAAVGDHNYDTVPQSAHVSQILTSPFGKILRLRPEDGKNPTDNPFFDGSSTDWPGAVWALGLRNPYTFAFEPGAGRMFVNDVGESSWEEINRGEARANYGWAGSTSPLWEGFNSPPPSWANYRDPIMAYDHSASPPTPAGVAVTGGTFYPANGPFGAAYAGKYFFADFGADFIRVFDPAHPGSVNLPDTSTAFASALTGPSPVDLKVDSAGRLYYLSRGSGKVYRIAFQAPSITRQPADATVNVGQPASFSVQADGGPPLAYQWQKFDGTTWLPISGATAATYSIPSAAASDAGQYRVVVTNSAGSATSNPATLTVVVDTAPVITQQPGGRRVNEGDPVTLSVIAVGAQPLSYQWQKLINVVWSDVPGATGQMFTIPAATVSDAGEYRVIVTNPRGNTTSDPATLTVNLRPTASISAPDRYAFGQSIDFTGTANDPEDGTLPAAAYTSRIDFGHRTHFHPHVPSFGGVTGGSFAADFAEPDPDQFYRIILTVTDSNGAATTVTRDVRPELVTLNIGSEPRGAAITLDGQPSDGLIPSVVGMPHTLQAPAAVTRGGLPYRFAAWSDGGAATHAITTPASDTNLVATYARVTPGFQAEYFDFPNPLATIPDLSGRAPDVTRAEPLLAHPATSQAWPGLGSSFADTFAARFTGSLKIDTPGRYTLTARSGDGSRVWLDGELVIDNDGVHDMRDRSATRTLSAGYHPLRVEYFENTGTAGLVLQWAGPGFAKQTIPGARLFHDAPATALVFRQDPGPDGLVVMEAEHNDGNVPRSGKFWRPGVALAGFAGSGFVWAVPDSGIAFGTGFVSRSPRLDFQVYFERAGTYYVWARGRGANTGSDSLHVGLDGAAVTTADRMTGLPANFGWTRATADGVRATIEVAAPGIHTVNVWMWEDGAVLDRLLLTTSADFVPRGLGPAESSRTAAAVDQAGGFAGATGLQFNGSAGTVGSVARLTASDHQAGSLFSTGPVGVASFATTFDFRLTSAVADGFAFVIQGGTSAALGAGGSGLGYEGIGNSVAVKFDLFDNAGEGGNSTGLYTNGQSPTTGGSDLTASNIDLHSGHDLRVSIAYAAGTLRVDLRDLSTGSTASQSYAADIPTLVRGPTALVGFTGGTGALSATQDILDWVYWD